MITLDDCFKTRSIEASALTLVNKIAFCPRKGYTSADGETYWDFAGKLKQNLKSIKNALHSRQFTFNLCLKKTRQVHGRWRDLYISTWRDKIVERWLNDCLNLLLNHWFSRNSYAYRITTLGLDNCQTNVLKSLKIASQCGGPYIIKRDVSKFFYSIDHDLLMTQLIELVNPNDYLYKLLEQRVRFQYHDGDLIPKVATVGVPFGSSIACSLANIFLTGLDKKLTSLPIAYFRYADDFLIIGYDPDRVLQAANLLDSSLTDLKLDNKETHKLNVAFVKHHQFELVNKFKYLGIEYNNQNITRLSLEKQRKIANLFRRELSKNANRLQRLCMPDRVRETVCVANGVIHNRIRSVAIIDYYLKHVDDEVQLAQLDLLIAKMIISTVLGKRFRQRDFSVVPYKSLRQYGLVSLVHRRRLHRHGKIIVNFLDLHNDIIQSRYEERQQRRQQRIASVRLAKRIKRTKPT